MVKKAKTIDELYREIEDGGFTLVITNEIALATALNNRLRTPKIGPFALTPRQIARLSSIEVTGTQIMEDPEIVSRLFDDDNAGSNGLDRRYILGELQYYRQLCRFVPDPLDFVYTDSSKDICRRYENIDNTLESVMRSPKIKDCGLYSQNRTAVIGRSMFNYIDERALPDDFTDIDPFVPETDYNLDKRPIYRVGNDMQIAEHIASMIDKDDAGSYAVVFNPESDLLSALKVQFTLHGIRYIDRPPITDLFSVRDYLSLLEQSLRYLSLERKDMIPILRLWGLGCFMKGNGSKFHQFSPNWREADRINRIKTLMSSIYQGRCTFRTALNSVYRKGSEKYDTVSEILTRLGMGMRSSPGNPLPSSDIWRRTYPISDPRSSMRYPPNGEY